MSSDKVYAVSDGNLYSVDKQTEEIRVYSNLHGVGISCIDYIPQENLLFIGYGTGKIDLLSGDQVQYISALYDKDMTQRKNIYNLAVHGNTAYLATHYGVQTFDLREKKLVDSYWLRPSAKETPIEDVLISNDSLYAFASDSLYVGSLQDNLVDYRYWKREKRTNRISPDPNKGLHYTDANSDWYAGGSDGIVRVTATERLTYKPQGPLYNKPYHLDTYADELWVVPGGRWGVQYSTPGVVMHYAGGQWTNISTEAIKAKTGNPTLDFMNVAVDPRNKHHYFVTSYGTGLYEFNHDTLVRQYLPGSDNTLASAVPNEPRYYTRLSYAKYDGDNNLWLFVSEAGTQLHCLDASGQWHGVNIYRDNSLLYTPTPGGLVFDNRNPNHKWFCMARSNVCVCRLDDNGTRFDDSDDVLVFRDAWTDQYGKQFKTFAIQDFMQDAQGRVWVCSDDGVVYIDAQTNYVVSDAVVVVDLVDENGETPFVSNMVKAICQTPDGHIWLGTAQTGVYELNSAATQILTHFTMDNSVMPSSGIMSLAADVQGTVYIGTSEGLVAYNPNGIPDGTPALREEEEPELDMGWVQQWKLHLSYNDPTQLLATPRYIYAVASGALFAYDRQEEQLEYWSRATGLSGLAISRIAYDEASDNLIIAYDDGRIDLMDGNGNIRQMPDLYMKAGSVSTTINSICVGSEYAYLAMPFGIIAINMQKAEVTDTYYIGAEASSVNVKHILQQGDSLYAFADDFLYVASLKDNLADYAYWHQTLASTRSLQDAALHRGDIYTLQHDSLYCLKNNTWQLVLTQPIKWMHAADGQMLVYLEDQGMFRLNDANQLSGLTNQYIANDGLYSNGEYWLGEKNKGLVRLATSGDESFYPTGPNTNSGYCLTPAHAQLYSANGGRWATEYINYAKVNIFDGTSWRGYDDTYFTTSFGMRALDPVSIAVDPQDPAHFFVATYGTGLLEFHHYEMVRHHTWSNSTLKPFNAELDARFYTRTDGAMMDESGYLWVLNATTIGKPLHIFTPDRQWVDLSMRSGAENISFSTPTGIWPDRRDNRYKWMMDQRATQGVILFYDGGTPTDNSDDRCVKRSTFVDQNGNSLMPATLMCLAQDRNNRIWIGTPNGIIIIPEDVDFFTSNSCYRIIIPRNDGTGLGDYLLGDEQVNCIAVDGGNRMWIGTANSGVYVIEEDTIIVAHFTETNSLLPSNAVQSITFEPIRGDIFVGTNRGIASYRTDASEAKETMEEAYAYPNPVRPGYGGAVSIIGLMENTTVNIIDAGGNLVCKTRSNGGTAVWDGNLPDGTRATPGIYTAVCNANGGHTVVKILFIR